jgi:hypothetical protein
VTIWPSSAQEEICSYGVKNLDPISMQILESHSYSLFMDDLFCASSFTYVIKEIGNGKFCGE